MIKKKKQLALCLLKVKRNLLDSKEEKSLWKIKSKEREVIHKKEAKI